MPIIFSKITKILKLFIFILGLSACFSFIFYKLESYKEENHEYSNRIFKQFTIKSNNANKFNHTRVDLEGKLGRYVGYKMEELKRSVTLVTAYFDLGSFQKGDTGFHTTNMYKKWMRIFKRIDNNMIIYIEDHDHQAYLQVLRKDLMHKTKIVMINRDELDSFKYKIRISKIFQQKGYPQYHPNTVYPEYVCAMHAKYELMRKSVVDNPYKSRYFAWIDIGLFREMVPINSQPSSQEPLFSIHLPPQFDPKAVAYTEVNPRRPYLIPSDIIYANLVWVCGCYFIASAETMFRWTAEYREGVRWLMSRNLMSTDQQVIYILHNNHLATTPLQTYLSDGAFDKWFYLAYISRIFQPQ